MKHRYLKNVVTLVLDNGKCTGCGMCTNVCPHDLFSLKNGKAEISDRNLCMECGACAKNCPFSAIRVKAGVGCASYMIDRAISGKDSDCGCSGSDSGCC